MKKRINKTVDVCDFCEREGILTECIVCHTVFCILCGGHSGNAFNQPICKECIGRGDVQKDLEGGLEVFHRDRNAQQMKLKALPET